MLPVVIAVSEIFSSPTWERLASERHVALTVWGLVGGGESDLDLARAVGAGRVEHHVAVALLLGVVRPLSFILRAGRGCHNGGKSQGAKFCCVEMLHNGSVIVYGCKVTKIDAIRG